LALCVTLFSFSARAADTPNITVFAAASTTNAITDIIALFTAENKGRVTASFASSSTLAKQVNQGAPADVYLSANPKWMGFLEKNHVIEPGTRFDLLGNRLVLIAPLDSNMGVTISPGFDLAGLLGQEKLAMGDPDHVPAGIYGKQALTALGVWEGVASKVARSKDVRAALMLVERGEAPLGIVYATDAAISKKVKVVALFPENTHPAITYPVALVAGKATPGARAFLEFLKTSASGAVFEKYGFSLR
jgi:molybdate transport system substrate-binding protein